VLYFDYGNSEVVSTTSDVKQLSEKFRIKAPFVYKCTLAGVGQAECTEGQMEKFTSLTVSRAFWRYFLLIAVA